jgi:hypothetical protein
MATRTIAINFGEYLVTDPAAKYWVFFSSLPNPSNNYGRTNAILVQDIESLEEFGIIEMAGLVNGRLNVVHVFDYDNNSQGGRIPGTPVDITIVGIGLATSQYVKATATIGNEPFTIVSLVPLIENTYSTTTI